MATSPNATHAPSLAGADWLERPSTRAVLAAIAAGGHEARIVGGAVRNALLGLPVGDIDVATTAPPETVMRLAASAGLGVAPTGIAHGTVTVLAGHQPFEVTTLRHDVETDGRHARVAFTDDWLADASRRDFTINALYCDGQGNVLDPLGGYPDLAARRVRFIGDARERIREDYLRILRFFRFSAEYADGAPDGTGLAASVAERRGLGRLAGERIRRELVRLLVAHAAAVSIEAMCDCGIFTALLGLAPRPALFRRLAAVEAAAGLEADAMRRLSALAAAVAEDAERIGARLRLSSAERERLISSIGPGSRTAQSPDERTARAMLCRAESRAAYQDAIVMSWAWSGDATDDAEWRAAATLPARWQPPAFQLSGRDIVAAGVEPGPEVGRLLAALRDWWIDAGYPPEPDVRSRLEELVRAK
jgi:poly(A) polymerase